MKVSKNSVILSGDAATRMRSSLPENVITELINIATRKTFCVNFSETGGGQFSIRTINSFVGAESAWQFHSKQIFWTHLHFSKMHSLQANQVVKKNYNFHELNTLISLSDSARLNPLYHSCIVSSLYFVCFTWKCQVVKTCLFDKIINWNLITNDVDSEAQIEFDLINPSFYNGSFCP